MFENLRVAFLTANISIAAGFGTFLDLIPRDIGKLASALGILLTGVLIFVHISKELRERKRAALENEILRRKLDEG